MKRILLSCAFSICIFFGCISAHAADEQKRRKLAECNFEIEKVLVLYKVIYEGSRLGKEDDDIYEYYQKQIDAARSAEQRKKTERLIDEQRDKVTWREELVRQRLLDKCMAIDGLRFYPLGDDCKAASGKETASDCWTR